MQKQIILFASIFAVICASKDQITDGTLIGAESAIASNHIYSQPMQDNVAAESEVSKRGAAVVSTSTATSSSNENQGQSSQIDVGKWPKIVMNTQNCLVSLIFRLLVGSMVFLHISRFKHSVGT